MTIAQHELAALSGAALGGTAASGRSFTMPSFSNTSVVVSDNDAGLHGGRSGWSRDSYGQSAAITLDGNSTENTSRIFIDKVFGVTGSDGQYYELVVMKQEYTGVEIYTFNTARGTPPAGVTLTLQHSWGTDGLPYDKLGMGDDFSASGHGGPLGPNLLVNGDFEDNLTNNTGSSLGMTNAVSSGWHDRGHAAAQIHEQDYGHGNARGDAVVELERGVVLRQTIELEEAGLYQLLLDVTRRGHRDSDNTFQIIVNGQVVDTVTAARAETLTYELHLNAGEAYVEFKSLSHSYRGAGIDDVKLQHAQPQEGSLSGRYFIDKNNNGIDDDGPDNGVEGVKVRLLDEQGRHAGKTTFTDADGNYSFAGLDVGTYGVRFIDRKTGRDLIETNVGDDDSIDSDAQFIRAKKSEIRDIDVTAGKDRVDNDAGVAGNQDTHVLTIDFEDFRRGDVVYHADDCVTVSVSKPAGKKKHQAVAGEAMIFDTDRPTGGDSDLAHNGQGNVLIISEDGDRKNPDDNAKGGTFHFTFDAPSKVIDLKVIDTEEGGTVTLFDEADRTIKTIALPRIGDGEVATVAIQTDGVLRLDIKLKGSGAIDDIRYVKPKGNVAPTATDNLNTTDEDTTISGNMLTDDDGFGVDSDPDGDPLTVTAMSLGALGTVLSVTSAGGRKGGLTVESDGSYTFTPGPDFDPLPVGASDTLSFDYTVSDGNGGTDRASVTITINGLNDPPNATPNAITIDEDDSLRHENAENDDGSESLTLNVLTDGTADSDPDGDPLSVAATTIGTTVIAAGTPFAVTTRNGVDVEITVEADGAVIFETDGKFDDLNDGDTDAIDFSYTVSDGNGGTDEADVTINILGKGVAVPDVSINLVFVVDASRSSTDAGGAAAFFEGASDADADLDGDGNAASQLDAQLSSIQQISDAFAATGEADIDLSFILGGTEIIGGAVPPTPFISATGQSVFDAGEDLSFLFKEIDQSGSFGVARIDLGIEAATLALNELRSGDVAPSRNHLFLMSDNSPALSGDVANLLSTMGDLNAALGNSLELDALIFDSAFTARPFFTNLVTSRVADGEATQIQNQGDLDRFLSTVADADAVIG
ncbi:MAG: SdrD B-like domain-containing protein [Pseudomonadota bacterium]